MKPAGGSALAIALQHKRERHSFSETAHLPDIDQACLFGRVDRARLVRDRRL